MNKTNTAKAILTIILAAIITFSFFPQTKAETTTNFGQTTPGTSTCVLSGVYGSRFICHVSGQVQSITAYIGYNQPIEGKGNKATGTIGHSIANRIRGRTISIDSYPVIVQSVSAYIYCSTTVNIKAGIQFLNFTKVN